MAPTAVALCGKSPEHIEGLSKLLLPQGYDIIHVCRDLTAALTELPALLSSDSSDLAPSSGFGSNVSKADKTPGSAIRGVIIGGGYVSSLSKQKHLSTTSTPPSRLQHLSHHRLGPSPSPLPRPPTKSPLPPPTPTPLLQLRPHQSPDDVTQIQAACDKVKPLPFFRADVTKPRPEGSKPGPPPVEEIGKRVLESFETATKDAGGSGGWEAGVYLF